MSTVPDEELKQLNQEIYDKGFVDREHLLKFLTLIPTNDAPTIIKEVQDWLKSLNENPKLDKVNFPEGDINAIIGDLDSYGRVQPLTIQQFKQDSNRVVDQVS